MTGDSFEHLRGWVGKKEVRSDSLTAWPIAALAATLDEPELAVDIGIPVPNGWHWISFWKRSPLPNSVRTDIQSAADFFRRCLCPGACGRVAGWNLSSH